MESGGACAVIFVVVVFDVFMLVEMRNLSGHRVLEINV